jgi:hypothetical protein
MYMCAHELVTLTELQTMSGNIGSSALEGSCFRYIYLHAKLLGTAVNSSPVGPTVSKADVLDCSESSIQIVLEQLVRLKRAIMAACNHE